MDFEFKEIPEKSNMKWCIIWIATLIFLCHVFLAWGAYFMPMPIPKPEDTPELKPCLAKYDLAQLAYLEPDGLKDDIDKVLQISRYEGYLDYNGKMDPVIASNILINRFNWSEEDVDAAMNYIMNWRSSFFKDCYFTYHSFSNDYIYRSSWRKHGMGWLEVGPMWVYEYSLIFNNSFFRSIADSIRSDPQK